MRSIIYKHAAALVIGLLMAVSLVAPVRAYEPQDLVGQPNMLLTAVSGIGSLSAGSTLGDAAADALVAETGADFAIIAGGLLERNLEPKEVTYGDICALFSDSQLRLATAQVTVPELVSLLEAGVSCITLTQEESIDRGASEFGGFPQVSGLKLTYDASALPGDRVMRITVNGEKLDLDDSQTTYTLVSTEDLLSGNWSYPVTEHQTLNVTLGEAMADFVAAGTPEDYEAEDRIVVVGCTEYDLVNHYPIPLMAVVAALIWTCSKLWKYKKLGEPDADYHRPTARKEEVAQWNEL